MRHYISFLMLIIVIFSMSSCKNSRFIRKEIKHENIIIYWYYYSYISSNSADIIEVSNGNESKIIFKGTEITAISLVNDTIIIQLYAPWRGIIYENNTKDRVFGYQAIIDTSATLDDYKKIPDGKKESFFHCAW